MAGSKAYAEMGGTAPSGDEGGMGYLQRLPRLLLRRSLAPPLPQRRPPWPCLRTRLALPPWACPMHHRRSASLPANWACP